VDPQTQQVTLAEVLALADAQHGVVTRAQLTELGLSAEAIKHRVRRGRLHGVRRGVYAVGRPQLTRLGTLMSAVLACGAGAALSGEAAAELYGIRRRRSDPIEVTVPGSDRKVASVLVRRRRLTAAERTLCRGIPVTTAVRTLLDLAPRLARVELEAAVNEADKLDLIDPEALRAALDELPRRRGAPVLRELLDRRTFRLTDSELERRFLQIVQRTGLPPPETQRWLNGFRVDFYWPRLGLVVETDGLRYHRTPAQQARDRLRDQAQLAAGLTPVRFTHAQVAFAPAQVERVLGSLAGGGPRPAPRASP
jgi:very-short-patch-repair endonuclease